MVNHPKHYKAKNGMEAIDVIEAFTEGLNGIEATDTGNIIKYALRWKEKNGVEDLKKIVWYANHLIEHLEKGEPPARGKLSFETTPINNKIRFECPYCHEHEIKKECLKEDSDGALYAFCFLCPNCRRMYNIKIYRDLTYDEYLLYEKKVEKETLYKISDIVKFPYGTKFENVETGTIYIIEQQLKILKNNGDYDYPALDKESFEENYRLVK